MNLKKFLQQQAEQDAESLLTEEDKKFIQRLIQKIEKSERQELTEELLKNDTITSII